MKKCSTLVMVGLLQFAVGCSGTDETEVPLELGVASDAVWIDSVQWNGERLDFYDARGAGEDRPAILLSVLGPEKEPELGSLFGHQARYPLTAAEIWRAAVGGEDLPEQLWDDHLWQVAETGRPLELQDFDGRLVDKASLPTFAGMFPIDASSAGNANLNNVCWTHAVINSVLMGLNSGRAKVSTCSEQRGFIRNFGVEVECARVTEVNGTIRTGTYNGTTSNVMTGQHCFASGGGAWQCLGSSSVVAGFYFATSFFKNGTAHRLGSGAAYSGSDPATTLIKLGSAQLVAGIPTFENPTLCSF